MREYAERLRMELKEKSDPARRESTQRFFKEPVAVYGVKSADVTKIARQAVKNLKGRAREDIFSLCEELWRSGYLEEGGIACELAYAGRAAFAPEDLDRFERWIEIYVTNWASCDVLCNHTVAACIEAFPDQVHRLKEWTGSSCRWKRRAAAVTLIIPARKGLFLADILDIAERLMPDSDDLVQKGYGWMLKAASEAHPDAVFEYLTARRTVMPRTAFRYALEKFPRERRDEAMGKKRSG